MRNALAALAGELRRLKDEGVRSVAVSEESLAALRTAAIRLRETRLEVERPVPRPLTTPPELRSETVPRAVRSTPVPESDRGSGVPAGSFRAKRSGEDAASTPKFPPPPVVELGEGGKQERWDALRERVLSDPVCRAHVRPGKKVVLGVGNLDARILFVGEAPGADEEIQGEPFVGPAGQLLNRMIAGTGLQRADVYIGNIMNWRPEMPAGPGGVQVGNRPPTAEEMAYCLPYLLAQIRIVDPALIVALGATAAQGLLGPGVFRALGEIRGRWREFQGRPLMVTYHPSYILRNPTNRSKRLIWEDFLQVMEKAGMAISEKQRAYFLP